MVAQAAAATAAENSIELPQRDTDSHTHTHAWLPTSCRGPEKYATLYAKVFLAEASAKLQLEPDSEAHRVVSVKNANLMHGQKLSCQKYEPATASSVWP